MEATTLLLLGIGIIMAFVTGPRLIQIHALATKTHKGFGDGHERASDREENWYPKG